MHLEVHFRYLIPKVLTSFFTFIHYLILLSLKFVPFNFLLIFPIIFFSPLIPFFLSLYYNFWKLSLRQKMGWGRDTEIYSPLIYSIRWCMLKKIIYRLYDKECFVSSNNLSLHGREAVLENIQIFGHHKINKVPLGFDG